MKTRWIVIIILALALAACAPKVATPAAGGGQAQPTEPGGGPAVQPPATTNIDRIDRLDPALANESAAAITPLLYSQLVAAGETPDLAVSWAVSENGLEYTFVLRQGVLFHDDTPFNADSVLANFDRWYNPDSALRGSGDYAAWKQYFLGFLGELDASNKPLSFFDGVEKVDDYTVILHLNRPEPNLLAILADPHFAMVNPAAVALNPAAFGTNANSVVGTGPYRVGTWTESKLTLIPNPGYYGNLPAETLEFTLK